MDVRPIATIVKELVAASKSRKSQLCGMQGIGDVNALGNVMRESTLEKTQPHTEGVKHPWEFGAHNASMTIPIR